jgi:Lamin Tail Domain/CARDB/FlgD Ig-like domain
LKGFFLLILFVPISFLFGQADTSLIISEVMFIPTTGNNEFVEIYNRSETESFDLNNYQVKYYTSNPDVITAVSSGTVLGPQSFAVVLEGDYDFISGIYNEIIPPEALVLKISDNAFGTNGMSNTTDRPVWLLNTNGDTLDGVTYTANNPTAISDEKIKLNHDSTQSNWANSLLTNGTPGFRNSVTPYDFDLMVSAVQITPAIIFEGDNAQIDAELKNIGEMTSANFSVKIFNDLNFDSTGNSNELIYSQSFSNLVAGDSISVTTVMSSLPRGNYQIIVRADYSADEDTTNNKKIKTFTVYPPGNNFNDIVINEIMYAPPSGQPEWVELFNRSANSINVNGWKFSDNSTSVNITNNDIELPPNSFIVLSKDSSILDFYSIPADIIVFNLPQLNNSGDAVVIKDSMGVKIDSVYYFPGWGGLNGKSLERISTENNSLDSLNWKTCISRLSATPGYINSVTPKDYDLELSDIAFDPPFPAEGDNVSISAKIKNNGSHPASFSISLYEDTNLDSIPDMFIKSISNLMEAGGDSSIFQFDYVIQNLQNKKGFYAIINYNEDQDTSNNSLYKSIQTGLPPFTILINEIMYNPTGGEPEWVELYNSSDQQVNLLNWTISDVVTTPVVVKINEAAYIPPKSYFIITKSLSISNYHRYIPSQVYELSLPVLNNDMDGVVLKDSRGQTMDSVFYRSSWGGTNGYSLERKDVSAPSNLESNWGFSTDIELSTPGRINSITPKVNDLSISQINFNPRFPVPGDNVYISAKVKNNGTQAAQSYKVEFYIDTDSNSVVDSLLGSVHQNNLASKDSASISSASPIVNLKSRILCAVRILFENDEDTLNNYVEKSVEPGIAQNTILINEVMYDPENSEPEWIEFVNVSGEVLNIKNWSISDLLSSPTKNFITTENNIIEPDEYFIVTKDTTFYSFHPEVNEKVFTSDFGTLGNSEDGIIIYDFRDGIIDSLKYKSDWGGKNGHSLERISLKNSTNDSTNWATSLSSNGSTPGQPNSILGLPDNNRNDLVINEIMFDPGTDNSEFIEFYNRSENPVNIGGWKISDENGNYFRLSDTSLIIQPSKYFVLSSDSAIITKYNFDDYLDLNILNLSSLGLSNQGELILLKNVKEEIIDSVWYSDKWHNKNFSSTKNISLERINPGLNSNDVSNWSSSVDKNGATPLKQNSIYTIIRNEESKISVSPNPFSPDNDGNEDFTIINYNLSQPTSQVQIKIFDSHGRLVRTLENNMASGSSGSVIFDGLDDSGRALRIGIYIIFLQATNSSSGFSENMKTVVVVARKL